MHVDYDGTNVVENTYLHIQDMFWASIQYISHTKYKHITLNLTLNNLLIQQQ